MKRRGFVKALAAAPAVPAVLAQQQNRRLNRPYHPRLRRRARPRPLKLPSSNYRFPMTSRICSRDSSQLRSTRRFASSLTFDAAHRRYAGGARRSRAGVPGFSDLRISEGPPGVVSSWARCLEQRGEEAIQ